MKNATVWLMWPLAWLALGGCLDYGSNDGDQDECRTIADCNPGQTCGDLVPCVDGECRQGETIERPCQQVCRSDADCPEGMHCRVAPDDGNECVADGACEQSHECAGQPHDACPGVFECTAGVCTWACLADDECGSDLDCVLADRDCCCGHDPDDYIAVHRDRLDEWRNRPECREVDCPAVECEVEDLFAVCRQGACQVEWGPPVPDCAADSDCVEVPGDCCGCTYGGLEVAVQAAEEQGYLAELEEFCAVVDVDCGGHDACTERPAVCRNGACTVLGGWCDCPQSVSDWDPVCASSAGAMMTLPSECITECLGMDFSYHGRCDCMMECFVPDPVCAQNGQTYWCGEYEAGCNGQHVVYPGECSEACDLCLMLGRPSIPACGTDFADYDDMCFAECRGIGWWHTGQCLEGEGQMCGGIAGIMCPSDELVCLYDEMVPDAAGVCIKRGHCQAGVQCQHQNLPHDDCDGIWTCPDHVCTWVCD